MVAARGDLGRGARPGRRTAARRNRAERRQGVGLFSCSKATNEMNFLHRSSRGRSWAATTSIAATAPDTPPASSVWRRCSERAAGPAPTGRSRRPISSCCGVERARDASDLLPPPAEGVRRGARLYAVDPRRTTGRVGRRVARARRRLGHRAGQHDRPRDHRGRASQNREFIEHATTGFEAYARRSSPTRSSAASAKPACRPTRSARWRTRTRAPIAPDLLDARHHRAPQRRRQRAGAHQPGAADRPRRPLRLRAVTAARAEQRPGRRRHGRDPEQAPGFQDIERRRARPKFEARVGPTDPAERGDGTCRRCSRRWSAAICARSTSSARTRSSPRPISPARHLLEGLDFLVVQDMFLTKTAEMADVVLASVAAWCESEGTVTNSERRVQRVRKALDPPATRCDDIGSSRSWPGGWGTTGAEPTAETIWDELRSLSPMHTGMSYARLEELGGIQWPCSDEEHPGTLFLHGRLWERPTRAGTRPPRSAWPSTRPWTSSTDEFPFRLTTGRRLDRLQHGRADRPVSSTRFGEARRSTCRRRTPPASACRGRGRAGPLPARLGGGAGARGPRPAPGLTFMTLHFPDEAETNALTIDATDPKSGPPSSRRRRSASSGSSERWSLTMDLHLIAASRPRTS